MKKAYHFFLILLALTSCRAGITRTEYIANPNSVTDPISVIKNTINQQPPAYAYMPVYIEVDKQCIKLYMESYEPIVMPIIGGDGGVVVGQGSSKVAPEYICYKNIGRIDLFHIKKDNLWRVEIDDKRGNYMYWIYAYERSDAEHFIDALYNFVGMK